jgi:hypothetical protein
MSISIRKGSWLEHACKRVREEKRINEFYDKEKRARMREWEERVGYTHLISHKERTILAYLLDTLESVPEQAQMLIGVAYNHGHTQQYKDMLKRLMSAQELSVVIKKIREELR